jgi:hypothetical protein
VPNTLAGHLDKTRVGRKLASHILPTRQSRCVGECLVPHCCRSINALRFFDYIQRVMRSSSSCEQPGNPPIIEEGRRRKRGSDTVLTGRLIDGYTEARVQGLNSTEKVAGLRVARKARVGGVVSNEYRLRDAMDRTKHSSSVTSLYSNVACGGQGLSNWPFICTDTVYSTFNARTETTTPPPAPCHAEITFTVPICPRHGVMLAHQDTSSETGPKTQRAGIEHSGLHCALATRRKHRQE